MNSSYERPHRPSGSDGENAAKRLGLAGDTVVPRDALCSQARTSSLAVEPLSVMSGLSGPLPSPKLLGDYEHVLPGLAERIVRMAEQSQQHSMLIDARALRGDLTEARLGQMLAFALALLVTGEGAYLVASGHDVAGTLFSGVGVVGVVYSFIQGKKRTG